MRSVWMAAGALCALALVAYAGLRAASSGPSPPPLQASPPPSSWVSGSQLLAMERGAALRKYGRYIIHQSWKTARVPRKNGMAAHFDSWARHHPRALHVLWSDEDNLALMRRHYQEFLPVYLAYPLPVQRADMVRALYLHRFGGIYADLDYEAKGDLWEAQPQPLADVYIVASPVLFNEVLQNSLMASPEPEHPYWYEVASSMKEIATFIADIPGCHAHGWAGCTQMEIFSNYWFGEAAHLIMVNQMTGPAVLDKTAVRHRDKPWRIVGMPADEFFMGTIAKHHQTSVWVNISGALFRFIVAVVCALLAAFSGVFLLTRHYYLSRSKSKQRATL